MQAKRIVVQIHAFNEMPPATGPGDFALETRKLVRENEHGLIMVCNCECHQRHSTAAKKSALARLQDSEPWTRPVEEVVAPSGYEQRFRGEAPPIFLRSICSAIGPQRQIRPSAICQRAGLVHGSGVVN